MKSILIIDDDSGDRNRLRIILENAGFRVDEAPEGSAGLRLYRENDHDLVITDIVMPGTEGIETILELKRTSPDVKIIAISEGGHLGAASKYLNMASALGAQHVFEKPISGPEILQATSELLG